MFRRLFSSSARVASELVTAAAEASRGVDAVPRSVDIAFVPPAIQRHIRREVAKLPPSRVANIPNPFLVHSFNKEIEGRPDLYASQKTFRVHHPPAFSVRRQKQLMGLYPAEHLPPSATNPVESLPVKLEDGTLVNWVGKWFPKKEKSVYPKLNRMFKGTRAERDHNSKIKEREDRMATMEKRIADWKKSKAEAKITTKSSLPF